MSQTPYRIKVHNLETCNCNHGCGCQFAGYPDFGHCEALLAYQVIEGFYGDVDLAGVKVVIGVKWPGAIHEGGGHAVIFVDESASSEQVDGILQILSGQSGGMPWEALSATLDKVEGPILKPVQIKLDGRNSSFRIDGILNAEMGSLIDPVTQEPKNVHIVYPQGGLIWDDGDVGTTHSMEINHAGLSFAHPGRFAVYATPVWTNQE